MSTVLQTIFGSPKREAVVLLLLNVVIAVTMVAGPWFATAPNEISGVSWTAWCGFVMSVVGSAANAAIGFMSKKWEEGRAVEGAQEKP